MYREDKAYMIRKLGDLSHSKFRSCFLLKEKEKQYVWEKGLDVIEKHARDFIVHRLAPAIILKDGKQGTSGIYCATCNGYLLPKMSVSVAQHKTRSRINAGRTRLCYYSYFNLDTSPNEIADLN